LKDEDISTKWDDSTLNNVASSAIKAVKRRRRPNVEGNRILKIAKNPVTRRPRKSMVVPKEIEETEETPERGRSGV
jgi:hypothetical protein